MKNAFLATVVFTAAIHYSSAPAAAADIQLHGRYCTGTAPSGWRVVAENKQKVAFGADFLSGDGLAAAGYSSFSSGGMAPDQAVASNLTGFGKIPTRFANKRQTGQNEFSVEWESASVRGTAWYKIFPEPTGAVIIMRTANTAPANWQRRGAEASAVARSLICK